MGMSSSGTVSYTHLSVDFIVHFQGIEQGGKRFSLGEIRIDHGADDLNESCLLYTSRCV